MFLVQRAAEHDDADLNEVVHESCMFGKERLLAQVFRPVPRAAVLLVDEEKLSHQASRTIS